MKGISQDLPLEDGDAVAAADVVGNLGSEALVVHEKELNLGGVVDEESLVAGRHHVAGLLVGTVTDL